MNISRLSNTPANVQPAPARPAPSQPKVATTSDQAVEGKRHGALGVGKQPPKPVAERPEPTEGQVEGTEDHGHVHTARVANFASRIETRLQNAIANGHLSEDQITALKAATEQFTALMNRIANADFSHSPQRQVQFALSQLHSQIQTIFHPQGDAQPEPGSGLPPTIDAVA